MTEEEKEQPGGKHGIRHYEGFTEAQHKQDVEGNNAMIAILEEEIANREANKSDIKDTTSTDTDNT